MPAVPLQSPVLQYWPAGQELVLQQNLSTQKPESHCAPALQVFPFGAGCVQVPLVVPGMLQEKPVGQEAVLQQT